MSLDEGQPMLQEAATGGVSNNSNNDTYNANNDTMQQQQIHRTSSDENQHEHQQMSERDRLQSMGSMLDDDEEEEEDFYEHVRTTTTNSNSNNNNNKQVLGPAKQQQAMSSKNVNHSVQYTSFATQLDKENNTGTSTATTTTNTKTTNNENANNNNTNQLDTAMMRQHRRRLLAGGQVAATILTPHNAAAAGILTTSSSDKNIGWNGIVRKGTRLKSFLDDALQHVATGYAVTTNPQGTKRQRVETSPNDENQGGMSHENGADEAASDLAKDKTKEVIILQQKLEEAQAQVASLTASNETLREETTTSSLRFERTIEALQIAAANAASARTDADQAELSAEGLATQLEALKTVVDQTKQAAQVLHEEHDEIATQARNGQAQLLQVEAELARSQKETKQLTEKAEEWETKAKELQEEATTLKRQLADQKEEARKLTTALEERDALEKARKERSQQVEEELREAQALLVSATAAAANSDVLESLNESVEKLQSANKALHEQLMEQQATSREDKERLRESLLVAEKDAQQLRIEASLQSDQKAGPKTNDTADSPDGSSFQISTTLNMTSTPTSGSRRDSHAVPPSVTCSICFKKAFGLMKSCNCGKPDCGKRAHIKCAERVNPGPSVSHPGTPGAKLPLVLCSGALADIMTNNSS